MSKARLVITAIEVEGRTVAEVVAAYGVSRSWVYELLARYRDEGDAAFEPRSRRPRSSPTAIGQDTIDLIIRLRKQLTESGLDAGPDTICWHLQHHHGIRISAATVSRTLTRQSLVEPQPRKRPKASYIRFEAHQPNETWQSDFTHYRLATGADTEIITWLDDHSRYALHVSAHHRISGQIVVDTFGETAGQHGYPASVLTDNGMVYTTRFSGGRGGRNALESELARLHIVQKNSRPNHPTTCGKVERFQQTLKKWLTTQPAQPGTIEQLQALIDTFREAYNGTRPHRSLPHRATPATAYNTRPKAGPGTNQSGETHYRVLSDIVDRDGKLSLRLNGTMHHIGIGTEHARTPVPSLCERDVRAPQRSRQPRPSGRKDARACSSVGHCYPLVGGGVPGGWPNVSAGERAVVFVTAVNIRMKFDRSSRVQERRVMAGLAILAITPRRSVNAEPGAGFADVDLTWKELDTRRAAGAPRRRRSPPPPIGSTSSARPDTR